MRWSAKNLLKHVVPRAQLSSDLITSAEVIEMEKVTVYPTIFENSVQVEYSGTSFGSWVLFDIVGRPVITGKMSGKFSIDTRLLNYGFYLFKYNDSFFRIVKR